MRVGYYVGDDDYKVTGEVVKSFLNNNEVDFLIAIDEVHENVLGISFDLIPISRCWQIRGEGKYKEAVEALKFYANRNNYRRTGTYHGSEEPFVALINDTGYSLCAGKRARRTLKKLGVELDD